MSPARAPASAAPGVGAVVLAAAALAAGALAIGITTDGAVLRLVGGAVFVLAIGAGITSFLQVGSGDRVERVALALGLGLAAIVVGGLLLDLIDALNPTGWIGLGAVIVGVGALARSRRPAARPAPSDATAPPTAARRPMSVPLVALTGLVCVGAVSVALVIAVDSAHEQTGDGFTTLAFDVPTERSPELGVVVENRERIDASYRLVATAGDVTLLTVDELRLAADERRRLTVPVADVATGTVVDVVLYRDGGAEPYRRVTVTVP